MNNKISGLRSSVSGKLFERTVVGFDLRKNSSLDSLFMTSYDEAVRYEEINEQYRDQQSGLNLFYIDPSDIPSLTVPVDARIIAFDLPTEFVEYLLKGNVSSPHPLPLPLKNSGIGWKFMGFDIVDAITQTSAFHGFDLTKSYLNEVMEKYTLRFNDCGLIDNAESASIVAKFFDKLILEHTPFMPCGVWLKEKNKAILMKIESKGSSSLLFKHSIILRELKYASRKNCCPTRETVFIHCAQSLAAYRKSSRIYDETASGQTYYNYFIDYNPAVGRYATRDPIGFKG